MTKVLIIRDSNQKRILKKQNRWLPFFIEKSREILAGEKEHEPAENEGARHHD